MLPVWLASFDAAEHERFAGSLRRSTPLRDAGLMISWLLDTAPDGAFDVACETSPPGAAPRPRAWWRRRYERAFGTIGPVATPAACRSRSPPDARADSLADLRRRAPVSNGRAAPHAMRTASVIVTVSSPTMRTHAPASPGSMLTPTRVSSTTAS